MAYSEEDEHIVANNISQEELCRAAKDIFISFPNASYILSAPEFSIIAMNGAMGEIIHHLGFENSEEAIGLHPWDVFPTWKDIGSPEIYKSVLKTGDIKHINGLEIKYSDKTVYWDVSLIPHKDKQTSSISSISMVATDISSYKMSENSLKSANDFHRIFADNSTSIIYLKDMECHYFFVNNEFSRVVGIPKENIIGKCVSEIFSHDVAEAIMKNDRQLIESGEPMEFEETMPLQDGLHIYMSRKFPIKDASGSIYAIGGISTDITERRKANAELRESEEKYREVVERANEAIVIIQDGVYKFVNQRFLELSGYTYEEVIEKTVLDFIAPQDSIFVYDYYRRRMSGEPLPETYDTALYNKFGKLIYLEISANIISYQGRNADMVLFRDITERKLAEYALDSERRRLKATLEALPVGVIVVDKNGKFTEINSTMSHIWGGELPSAECLDDYGKFQGWWQGTNDRLKPYDWAIVKAIKNGEICRAEAVDILKLDGTHGTIYVSASPVKDADGQIIGGVTVSEDITEMTTLRLALEQALNEEKIESQRANALESVAEAGISNLELQDLLEVLVERIAVGMGTHSCSILLLEKETGDFVTKAAYNDPSARGFRVNSESDVITRRIYKRKRTVYVENAENDPLIINPIIKRLGIKSHLGTPLIVRDKVIGMVFVQTKEIRKFSLDEVRIFEAMAARAALAIDNTKLYSDLTTSKNELSEALKREKHTSSLLQRALLPRDQNIGEGYKSVVKYLPSANQEIGGDFYDVFRTIDGKVGIVMGDVSGKGINAASLAAAARSTVRAMVYSTTNPAQAMSRSNTVLYPQQPEPGAFVTVFLGLLNPDTGEVIYVSAGHPPVAIYRSDGEIEWLKIGQPPIGILEHLEYGEFRCKITPGDKMVIYTDGISEARRGNRMLNTEGMERILKKSGALSSESLANAILDAANEWAEGKLMDDAAILIIERHPNC